MLNNTNLNAAGIAKNDEFYTQLSDVEKELKHYRKHFRGKTVYCNCDDPTISNFYRYFHLNFEKLGLKRLITTCYKNQQPDIFSQHDCEAAVGVEYEGEGTQPSVFQLKGDGDFRSRECVDLLKQADIVVTNPPFSLFREYVTQLMEHDKKFLIIGNMNAVTYKEIFPLIKNGRLWLGYAQESITMYFDVQPFYANGLLATKKEGTSYEIVDGVVKSKMRNAKWFTNLDHRKRHEDLVLFKRYTPEEYPKYDNYDAINVNKTAHIPVDYEGLMGVPITFLDKHNPDQFEIIWTTDRGGDGMLEHIKLPANRYDAPVIDGKGIYKRLIIKRIQV